MKVPIREQRIRPRKLFILAIFSLMFCGCGNYGGKGKSDDSPIGDPWDPKLDPWENCAGEVVDDLGDCEPEEDDDG